MTDDKGLEHRLYSMGSDDCSIMLPHPSHGCGLGSRYPVQRDLVILLEPDQCQLQAFLVLGHVLVRMRERLELAGQIIHHTLPGRGGAQVCQRCAKLGLGVVVRRRCSVQLVSETSCIGHGRVAELRERSHLALEHGNVLLQLRHLGPVARDLGLGFRELSPEGRLCVDSHPLGGPQTLVPLGDVFQPEREVFDLGLEVCVECLEHVALAGSHVELALVVRARFSGDCLVLFHHVHRGPELCQLALDPQHPCRRPSRLPLGCLLGSEGRLGGRDGGCFAGTRRLETGLELPDLCFQPGLVHLVLLALDLELESGDVFSGKVEGVLGFLELVLVHGHLGLNLVELFPCRVEDQRLVLQLGRQRRVGVDLGFQLGNPLALSITLGGQCVHICRTLCQSGAERCRLPGRSRSGGAGSLDPRLEVGDLFLLLFQQSVEPVHLLVIDLYLFVLVLVRHLC